MSAVEKLKAEFQVDMLTITSLHKQAAVESKELESASIDNDEDAADANAHLKDWLAKLDKVSAMKKETLAPLKEAEKRINALFKPLLDAGSVLTGNVRKLLETYELEKRRVQRDAMAVAASAARAQDPGELLEALQEAADAEPVKLDGTTFKSVWRVKRIIEGLLPFDGHNPDPSKRGPHYWKPAYEVGDKWAGKGEPAAVPGIVWVEELSSTVRR
jgi:hypothetical protein